MVSGGRGWGERCSVGSCWEEFAETVVKWALLETVGNHLSLLAMGSWTGVQCLLEACKTHLSPLTMGSGIEVKQTLLGAVGRC